MVVLLRGGAGVRRSLLTTAPLKITVGDTQGGGGFVVGSLFYLAPGAGATVANGAGTLTKITASVGSAYAGRTIAFFSYDANLVVTAVTGNFSSQSGVFTYSTGLALPVKAGDALGVWCATTVGLEVGSVPGTLYTKTTSGGTKPSAGVSLPGFAAVSPSTASLYLQGRNY